MLGINKAVQQIAALRVNVDHVISVFGSFTTRAIHSFLFPCFRLITIEEVTVNRYFTVLSYFAVSTTTNLI